MTGVEPDALPEMPLPWAPGPETQGPSLPSREDLSLPCAVDAPAAEGEVRGELVVTGWARAAGDDLDVRILIDGEIRTPAVFRRFPRLDLMTAALSYLGDTSTAGYEARYPFLDGDDGRHELTARFRARDGRTRHYPIRRFVWKR